MTVPSIRAALEQAVAAISPALATAYQNANFTPTAGTPYQRVAVLFARPANDEMGANYLEQGFLQVTLCYPAGAGPNAAETRAEIIRSAFPRGRSLTASDCKVLITGTPEIAPGLNDADRWTVPVRIPFRADVHS